MSDIKYAVFLPKNGGVEIEELGNNLNEIVTVLSQYNFTHGNINITTLELSPNNTSYFGEINAFKVI